MCLTPCHSSSPTTGRKMKNPEWGELDACYRGINTHWRHALQFLLIDQSRGFETMVVLVISYLIGHQNASIYRWNTTQYPSYTTLKTWDSHKYTDTSCTWDVLFARCQMYRLIKYGLDSQCGYISYVTITYMHAPWWVLCCVRVGICFMWHVSFKLSADVNVSTRIIQR